MILHTTDSVCFACFYAKEHTVSNWKDAFSAVCDV